MTTGILLRINGLFPMAQRKEGIKEVIKEKYAYQFFLLPFHKISVFNQSYLEVILLDFYIAEIVKLFTLINCISSSLKT